jgi:hypothetical protein
MVSWAEMANSPRYDSSWGETQPPATFQRAGKGMHFSFFVITGLGPVIHRKRKRITGQLGLPGQAR